MDQLRFVLRDWERHEAVRGAVLAYFSGVPVRSDGRWESVDVGPFHNHPLYLAVMDWWEDERKRLMSILG